MEKLPNFQYWCIQRIPKNVHPFMAFLPFIMKIWINWESILPFQFNLKNSLPSVKNSIYENVAKINFFT
jgi:hypothetical protein